MQTAKASTSQWTEKLRAQRMLLYKDVTPEQKAATVAQLLANNATTSLTKKNIEAFCQASFMVQALQKN